ncbi:MFS transporter [Acidiferrimicrobium sp. IK]|uniref:MFS transporter n=1 Tax=Acidiferrimicrobium sp. IK TaxID=2871700 RepID=UPI0021CB65A9|nr:MFS transporter [Acidiferrimicrobium sp. IK]MCU4183546.1 MFS transporter [Acidiferrimicrobium sp. IK]
MPVLTRAPGTKPHPTIALFVILACQLMVVLDATVVNIALPSIQHALHFTPAGLSWVINAYTLTFGGLLLLGGRAGDVFGRRRMLMAGLALFTASSLVGGLAGSSTMLLIARAVQGVGAAMAAPSTLALITATFEEGPPRNRALGLFTAVSAGGSSLGLILGGALTSWASWRWVLFINVPIGIAIILLAPRFVVEPARRPNKLDLPGGVLATGGLAALIYGFIRIASHGSDTALTVAFFVAAVAALGGFVAVEVRSPHALMPLRLLANRSRSVAFVDMLLVPAAMYGTFFFTSQFLENGLHYSAITAGFAFLPLTGLIFAMSRVTPRLVARYGPTPLLLTGLVSITAGMAWLSQEQASAGYLAGVFGPLLLFGFGAGSCFMPLAFSILQGVDRNDAGAASGMLQTMQQVGGSLGLAVLVTVAANGGRSSAMLTAAGFTGGALVLTLISRLGVRVTSSEADMAEEAELVAA